MCRTKWGMDGGGRGGLNLRFSWYEHNLIIRLNLLKHNRQFKAPAVTLQTCEVARIQLGYLDQALSLVTVDEWYCTTSLTYSLPVLFTTLPVWAAL